MATEQAASVTSRQVAFCGALFTTRIDA